MKRDKLERSPAAAHCKRRKAELRAEHLEQASSMAIFCWMISETTRLL